MQIICIIHGGTNMKRKHVSQQAGTINDASLKKISIDLLLKERRVSMGIMTHGALRVFDLTAEACFQLLNSAAFLVQRGRLIYVFLSYLGTEPSSE